MPTRCPVRISKGNHMSSTTDFNKELARLRKGIRIAWLVNFLILAMTIEAGLIIFLVSASDDNSSLMVIILLSSVFSSVVSAVITAIVSSISGKILMEAADGNLKKVTNGVVYNVVAEMATASMQAIPDVYIAENSGVANAYAVSDRNGSRIVITDKLLAMMTREELQGVVGHEIAHIASGDSRAMTTLTALTSVTAMIAGIASRMMGYGGGRRKDNDNDSKANPIAVVLLIVSVLFLIFSPLLAKIAESYMSRERESTADMLSVKYTRNPSALANALNKLQMGDRFITEKAARDFNMKAGNVAFYIPSFNGLALATHPPLDKRIQTLVSMGAVINVNYNKMTVEERMHAMNPMQPMTPAAGNVNNQVFIPGIQPGYDPRNPQPPKYGQQPAPRPYNAQPQQPSHYPPNPQQFRKPWLR